MTTTTYFNSLSGGKVVSTDVSIWYNKKYFEMKSEYMTVYSDKKDKFVILNNSNEIVWMKPDNIDFEKNDINKNINYQIEMINQMESINCDFVDKNQKKYKTIQVTLPKVVQEKSGHIMVNYEFDVATSQMYSIEQIFNYMHKYSKQTITYNRLDLNYSEKKMPENVKTLFLDSKNRLLPKYKTYKLVNQKD